MTTDPGRLQAADSLDHRGDGAAVIVLWAAFLVRACLLLLYISGLLAIGFSPIVRLIERQKFLPIGSRGFRAGWPSSSLSRDPRHVSPRRLARHAAARRSGAGALGGEGRDVREGAAVPDCERDLREHLTFQQAVQRAPGAGGSEVIGRTVFSAVVGSRAASSGC
jgi:hypothetical protein